jgi:hypothetical protein
MAAGIGDVVEIVHYLKKIAGKFMKDEGIYVFSKPTLAIILSEQQISVSEVWSDVIDTSLLGYKAFFIQNTQDVSIYVNVYARPSLNSTIETPLRDQPFEVLPGETKLAIVNEKIPACRLKFYAGTPPSKGYVNCVMASWSL